MYKSNIRILDNVWPNFSKTILSMYHPHPDARIIPTESGESALILDGRYLSSRRDPCREAERIMETRFSTAPDLAVFLHFGLGYELEAFFRRFPDTPAILIEPDIPLFLTALGARDFSKLFNRKNLVLLLEAPPSALAAFLNDRSTDTVEFYPIKSIARLHHEYMENLKEWLHRFQSRREINRNTLRRFGRVWVRNLLSNLQVLSEASPLGELEGILNGRPCLVLAAGPSLDTLVPYIHELRKRMAIIAVDTSAGWCKLHGIHPDFLVVVDPQYWNTRHLDPVDQEQVLVSESSTHPAVFRRIEGPRFFCSSLFPLGSFLEKDLNIYGNLGAGGSVSTSAWDLARFIGAGRIFCAGLDLGYPDLKTHFSGSLFEELSHIWSTRTNPSMAQHFRYIRDGSPLMSESTAGEAVLSDKRLSLYRWWFETRMSEPESPPTFTLSTQGVLIKGMEYADPKDLLSLPEVREELNTLLPSTDYHSSGTSINTAETILKGLASLDSALLELEKLCRKALSLLDSPSRNTAEIVSALEKIDAGIMINPAKDIAGFLLDSEPDSSLDPFTSSRKVYTSILNSVEYHREHLQHAQAVVHSKACT